jgi:hypothetical protein
MLNLSFPAEKSTTIVYVRRLKDSGFVAEFFRVPVHFGRLDIPV